MRNRQGQRRTTSFRLVLGGLAALIAGPAIAQSCIPAAERTAFDVRAVQSQLMVAALACGRDNDYNAFVRKFQRDLQASYNGLQSHFRRTAGAAGQRELDNFITILANAHSQDSIRAGSFFCPLTTPLFQQALAKNDAASLAEFAMERNIVNPMAAPACAAAAAPAARTPARPAARR
ncbi:hypothetical protein [Falsiroseomonas oryziterrae]|uniref:hypothetical protein n=1 Tax=Falsiroseomonas oryziterrae TaxID=2911368 RepID=UPI001F394888|nr:hypothetical protein [Roseomonas sp. NPKOSM-4]